MDGRRVRNAQRTVIVGVDESPESAAALRVAADEAVLRNARLVAVHAWHRHAPWGADVVWPGDGDPRTALLNLLTGKVAELQRERQTAGQVPIEVVCEVIEAPTEEEFRGLAAGAELLVIGECRQRGPSELVNSFAQSIITRPPCPVLVVPCAAAVAATAPDLVPAGAVVTVGAPA